MIEVSPLRHRDLAAVTELFNLATTGLSYRWPLDPPAFRALVLLNDGAPEGQLAVDPDGWLVARDGEHTVGFAHCTNGRLVSDPPDRRRGFLRSLSVAPRAGSVVIASLLAAADAYFSRQTVASVVAFGVRTGYPCCLAGRGVAVATNMELMTALGRAGYRMDQRWLLYERSFSEYLPEQQPRVPRLTLKLENLEPEGFLLAVANHADPVGDLVCRLLPEVTANTGIPTASVQRLSISADYQRLGVGSWLLLRAMNELVTRGARRLVVDISHQDASAQGMLLRLGFEELALTGVSYAR